VSVDWPRKEKDDGKTNHKGVPFHRQSMAILHELSGNFVDENGLLLWLESL
jgi:hypothetical protein